MLLEVVSLIQDKLLICILATLPSPKFEYPWIVSLPVRFQRSVCLNVDLEKIIVIFFTSEGEGCRRRNTPKERMGCDEMWIQPLQTFSESTIP
ncbi:uncharacterized protein GJ701_005960 isoform 2-T2 [Geothlypis trichas]